MIFAYDRHGNLTSHKVESGKIINVKDYEEYIKKKKKKKKKQRQAIRRKRPELLAAGPINLHDNAALREWGDVIARVVRVGNVGHPAYSPGISPFDFDLFLKLKEGMRGIRYNDLEELESSVAARVKVFENGCLATGIDDLPKRCKVCHWLQGILLWRNVER